MTGEVWDIKKRRKREEEIDDVPYFW